MARQSNSFIKFCAGCAYLITLALFPVVVLAAIITRVFAYPKAPKSVANEVAVVTGSGHGLGQRIAMELAAEGCSVAVVDINEEAALSSANQIRDTYKVPAIAYKVDVASYEQLKDLHAKVSVDLGTPTILVNNAGVLMHSNPLDPSAEEMQKMIDVNLTAHCFANKVFLPKMIELNRGHIVAVASLAAHIPLMYSMVYSATKAAVHNLMRVLRLELKTKAPSIRATTVYPVFLDTNERVRSLCDQTDLKYTLLSESGDEMARRIVTGMLQNEEEILMPSFMHLFYRCLGLLPSPWIEAILHSIYNIYLKDGSLMNNCQ